jgi:ubiquinone biosynthesis protein
MAIVTAALIVGSSIVMTVDRGGGVATLGLLGFIAAMLGGLWVLISVWRGGR